MTAQPIHLSNSTPFDLISEDAETWLSEAANYADGTPIETQGQADDVSRIIEALRKTASAADDARKVEVKPYDDAKKAVQDKFAPLFADAKNKTPGRVFTALDALKATLSPYLAKLDAIKREAERKAREEAEAKAREAQEAMRAAAANDMIAREEAEALVRQAEAAVKVAKAAEKDKAHATGGTRAMGLRSFWTATMTDATAAARHYWNLNPAAFNEVLQKLADDDVREGKRTIPGFTITGERRL
jgi:predicted transcriptional regulator